jgi:voltage-gated potassium channel
MPQNSEQLNVPEVDRRDLAGKTLAGLAIAAIAFALISFYVVDGISHNTYASGYYTISSLFDAVGINTMPLLQAAAPPFSAAFDALILISVIDGIVKIVAVGLALAAVVEILTGANIVSQVNFLATRRMSNHIIICGYSRIAEQICLDLKKKKEKFIVIDKNPSTIELLFDIGYLAVNGDFTSAETLEAARVGHARAIVFSAKDELPNLMGIITAKHINKSIKVISRASDEVHSITKMQRAGVELCVVPEVISGVEIGTAITERLVG